MFCQECGTKNEKGAKFCESCGAKLESNTNVPEKAENKKTTAVKKPLSKKAKIGIGVLVILVVLCIGLFIYGKNTYKPEKEALRYFEAIVNRDIDKLYDYLDVKSTKFTSKKVLKELMKEELEDDDDTNIINYKVGDTTISSDGLYAKVKINYTTKDSSESHEETITLTKGKKKKLLFFDDWKVQTNTIDVVENFDLKVLKGSEVTLANEKLTSTELNKKKSTDKFDVYTIPALFKTKYPVTVKFPLGFEVETSITPSSYTTSGTITVNADDLSDKTEEQLKTVVKDNLKTLYEGAIANKKFSDIKASFEYKNGDLSKLESRYDRFVTSLNGRTRKLTEIKFDDVEIRTVNITDEGYLEIYAKVSYDYKVTYKSGSEEKTNSDDSYSYFSMTFDYQDGYKLIETGSLNYYFY